MYRQCFQCHQSLPFQITNEEIQCPLCGAVNEKEMLKHLVGNSWSVKREADAGGVGVSFCDGGSGDGGTGC
ncbi:hypothetical protein EDC91_15510 [Shewanella fodinae]|jgi:hypothetical protein|uniref:Uncharacterized protein n=1 Tax=Shewanella fodinae TaxID=552357 RepID=A0A4R2F1G4_9GAMM|nr:hypothetical protein EDC91_15510 [Shewanella fodinae]